MASVVVVGAGIAGLSCAWQLQQAGHDVEVLEREKTPGGRMRSERRDGFILEKGPFNVIVRDPAFEDLLDDFVDEVQVVAASKTAGRRRFVLHQGRLIDQGTHEQLMAARGTYCNMVLRQMATTDGTDDDLLVEDAGRTVVT